MFDLNYKKILVILLFSIPNTFLSIGLLFIINTFLTGNIDTLPKYLIPIYFCFVFYSYLLNIFFQTRLVHLNYEMVYENEVKILKILYNTSLVKFEKYGAERFFTTLEDLRVFVYFPSVLTSTVNSILTVFVCLGYLFWISSWTTIVLIIFIFLLVGLYFIIYKKLSKRYENLRLLNEEYYKYVDDSIKGFKELKISSIRGMNFFQKHLSVNRNNAKKIDIDLTTRYLIINLVSQYGIYILLGIVLFFLTYIKTLNQKEVITYIVALLFLNGPINSLISMQNFLTRAVVSYKRINNFFKDFDVTYKEGSIITTNEIVKNFESMIFRGISFSYDTENKRLFSVKDLNLEITKGEVIFIVGGNGSGKSTFINILTGLYLPDNGSISLNGEIINSFDPDYKNLFSVVYTDNYIFSKNYDKYKLEGNQKYMELLKIMEMENIITDDDDESARKKFSKGQSKRLSLIFALLEEKPILVLDEWAADQDPHFRKYFYENLIPKLKREGKTIIAVTHDDSYFRFADRILKFEYGQIIKDSPVTGSDQINYI